MSEEHGGAESALSGLAGRRRMSVSVYLEDLKAVYLKGFRRDPGQEGRW